MGKQLVGGAPLFWFIFVMMQVEVTELRVWLGDAEAADVFSPVGCESALERSGGRPSPATRDGCGRVDNSPKSGRVLFWLDL